MVHSFSGPIILGNNASTQPLFEITPPTGKRVVLKQFTVQDGSSLSGVTVFGSILGVRIDGRILNNEPRNAGTFCVGYVQSANFNHDNAGALPEVVFEVDEIVAAVGPGSNIGSRVIAYSYTIED